MPSRETPNSLRNKGGRPSKESYLTPRWTQMRPHAEQHRFWTSPSRFKVVPAGRRSGKTELCKRKMVLRALDPYSTAFGLPRPAQGSYPKYFCGAPVWSQAKRIFWQDLKRLIPDWAYDPDPRRAVSETEMCIRLKSGAEIWVIGMDKPERVEGSHWDGCVLDEYGNMRSRTWPEHVRPALADREGWCDFIGVPEGRNHYWNLSESAKKVAQEAFLRGEVPEWDNFHWKSKDILPASEIESAQKDLDPLTFRQEFEADFLYFQGRVYYPFDEVTHCRPLVYDPDQPLIFCFDFNISPGVAVICQEQVLPGVFEEVYDEKRNTTYKAPVYGTGAIGEVFIPHNSNTLLVCEKLVETWGDQRAPIHIYGDATGGSGGSAKVAGSDWDLVKKAFKGKWPKVYYHIPDGNPRERIRVNAVNSRLMSASGIVRLCVDKDRCPNLVTDFEGTRILEGSADGSIDKRSDPMLTHLTDALGYYVVEKFPIQSLESRSVELLW